MFLESFKITAQAMAQIAILGFLGYFLVKIKLLSEDGLRALSRLVISVIFPVLIFTQLIKKFSFSLYPDWWIYPLISIAIMGAGFLLGGALSTFVSGAERKNQFLSLVAFQNSGYLPLALVAALLRGPQLDTMLIYLFLVLLGFDLVMWSFGVYILAHEKTGRFHFGSLFSPPVIANIASLLMIALGLNSFVPGVVLKPLEMVAGCTLPLAMFIVGGNIALIRLEQVDRLSIVLISLAKLIIMPAAGLALVLWLNAPELIGLMVIMQLAMPSATSCSVIIRYSNKEDILVSQGVFFTHILSLITIPVFLSLYFSLRMVK